MIRLLPFIIIPPWFSLVAQFNRQGIDGLIERPRLGRPAKINAEQSACYKELIEKPELAEQTHWTGVKFHGYLRQELQHEVGYRTVIRWLHDNNFRLKVPQSWPGRQNEEQRQVFIEELKPLLNDPEVDLWFLDESGIEGDPAWTLLGAEGRKNPYPLLRGTPAHERHRHGLSPTGEFYALEFTHMIASSFRLF